jgi:periplasmic protein CpxP/Spy
MRSLLALSLTAAMAFATVAVAQTGQPPAPTDRGQPSAQTDRGQPSATDPGNPAIKSPTPNSDRPGTSAAGTGTGTGVTVAPPPPLTALEAGSNSFTEGQARSRLEDAGFSNVTGLAKDEQGIWRGTAQLAGQTVTVGVDYKGNIGSASR